jgi:hypothetical protein
MTQHFNKNPLYQSWQSRHYEDSDEVAVLLIIAVGRWRTGSPKGLKCGASRY